MIAITYACGHRGQLTTTHGEDGGGAASAPVPCPQCAPAPTVKALDIFGKVHDLGASESQLNGWIEGGTKAPAPRERTVCVCGHGPQFHRCGCCERCSHRHWAHAYQRVTTEPLFVAEGALL